MTNIGSDQAVDRILARTPLTVPTLLVDSLWDQEDIYGAPAVLRRSSAAPMRISCSARGTTARPMAPATRSARSTSTGDTGKWFRANVMIPFLDQYLKDGPPAEHRPGHRVRGAAPTSGSGSPTGRRPACAAARRTSRRSTWRPARPRLRRAPPQGFDSYVSDPAKPVTYRVAPEPLAVDPGLDLALLAGRRPALRRRPPRRAGLFERAAARSRSSSPARRWSTSSPRPAAPTATGWSS